MALARCSMVGPSFAAALMLLVLAGCAESRDGGTDSSTHWLMACESDAACGTGLRCVCGLCSQPCDDDAACSALGSDASCRREGLETCADPPAGRCDAACRSDGDCRADRGMRCADGVCRPFVAPTIDAGSTDVHCAPMDAHSNCDDCEVDGYAWDGTLCTIRVECVGTECNALYPSFAECQRAHADCLGVSPCARMDDVRYVCDSAYGGDLGHVYNGADCEPVACGACAGSACSPAIVADSLDQCRDAYASCADGADGVSTACETPADCVLDSKGCCPPCAYVLDLMVAVAADSWDNHRLRVCQAEGPQCDPCAPPENPALYADCQASRCVGLDRDRFATCQVDADCGVRLRACCECDGSADDLVAVSDPAAYVEAACRLVEGCDDCAGPQVPATASARCEAGYCVLN